LLDSDNYFIGNRSLRAIRKNTLKSWLWYSLSLALPFYTHLFSASVAIAQALYVILLERLKITRTVVSYVLAAVGDLVLFSPWLFRDFYQPRQN
jgi:uncharacterized membrane protein